MPQNKKILVVDDDSDYLHMVKAVLEVKNYEVIIATNGKDALKKLKDSKPDVVFVDILMPQLDGLQTLKRIRRHNKDLPVFIITGFSDEERFKLANKLGASGFINKTNDLEKEVEGIFNAVRIAHKYK